MQCDALLLSLVVARVQLHSLLLITILLLLLLRRCASIQMQNEIGADVIMALDDVISSQTTGERVEEVRMKPYFWFKQPAPNNQRPFYFSPLAQLCSTHLIT